MGKYIKDCNQTKYHLSGVIVHHGKTADSGHYIAYSFVERANAWFEFDDDNVSEVELSTVLNQKAYMLFYTLVENAQPDSASAPQTRVKDKK